MNVVSYVKLKKVILRQKHTIFVQNPVAVDF